MKQKSHRVFLNQRLNKQQHNNLMGAVLLITFFRPRPNSHKKVILTLFKKEIEMLSKKVGIPLCIIGGIVWTLLVLGASVSWGHGEGECLTGVFSGNANYIKVLNHLDTVNGGHRHQEGYYNSLGVLQSKWFAESNLGRRRQ